MFQKATKRRADRVKRVKKNCVRKIANLFAQPLSPISLQRAIDEITVVTLPKVTPFPYRFTAAVSLEEATGLYISLKPASPCGASNAMFPVTDSLGLRLPE